MPKFLYILPAFLLSFSAPYINSPAAAQDNSQASYPMGFADLVEKLSPAVVVNISSHAESKSAPRTFAACRCPIFLMARRWILSAIFLNVLAIRMEWLPRRTGNFFLSVQVSL